MENTFDPPTYIEFNWEKCGGSSSTTRVKVIGGWMVSYVHTASYAVTMVFVPDPHHEWRIK